jgi:hypothetical protein
MAFRSAGAPDASGCFITPAAKYSQINGVLSQEK